MEISEQTDALDCQRNAFRDLGEVLFMVEKRDEAVATLEQALERYERKGNLVMAERVRTRLAELDTTAA